MNEGALHLTFYMRGFLGGEMMTQIEAQEVQAEWQKLSLFEWSRLKSELAAFQILPETELTRIEKELQVSGISTAITYSPISVLSRAASKSMKY